MALIFCTTNYQKFKIAQAACAKHGVEIEQVDLEVDEIQSSDPKYILQKKAEAMYKQIEKPLFVGDDTWSIPSLKGFPGPYMKEVNSWFTAEDWLNLMKGKKDRRIILEQRLAYIDESGITIFDGAIEHKFLDVASDKGDTGFPFQTVVALGSHDRALSEIWASQPDRDKLLEVPKAYSNLAKWYANISS